MTEIVEKEIEELVKQVIGKINNVDSRTEKASLSQKAMNDVVAGVDLSKLEKTGMMTTLLLNRVR